MNDPGSLRRTRVVSLYRPRSVLSSIPVRASTVMGEGDPEGRVGRPVSRTCSASGHAAGAARRQLRSEGCWILFFLIYLCSFGSLMPNSRDIMHGYTRKSRTPYNEVPSVRRGSVGDEVGGG